MQKVVALLKRVTTKFQHCAEEGFRTEHRGRNRNHNSNKKEQSLSDRVARSEYSLRLVRAPFALPDIPYPKIPYPKKSANWFNFS